MTRQESSEGPEVQDLRPGPSPQYILTGGWKVLLVSGLSLDRSRSPGIYRGVELET